MTKSTSEGSGYLLHRAAQQLKNWKRPPSPPIEPDLEADLEELQRSAESVAYFAGKLREAGITTLPAAANPTVRPSHDLLPMEAYPEADRLSAGEAAKIAKVHVNTVKGWVRDHHIGWKSASGRYIVCRPLLMDFLQSRGRFE